MAKDSGPQAISIRQHLIYTCSRLLAYGLPLLYFLVTSSFYLKTYDSAQVKITFVQMGASILLFIWLTKILLEGRLPFRGRDFIFVAPFIAHLLSGVMSVLNGPFMAWPFEEALRRFFYIIMALIVIAEFRSEERMERLWRWLFAAALLSTGYGLIQYIDSRFFFRAPEGIDPFIWRQAFGHRVFSTFGNPNFYGNFLVIVVPLILASILRGKGSLARPFGLTVITIVLVVLIDKMQLKFFGGFDPSFKIVFGALIIVLFFALAFSCVWHTSKAGNTTLFLVLFALIILNLYATETKGAWLGFVAAISSTLLLIFEFFLKTEETIIERKKYFIWVGVLVAFLSGVLLLMTKEFVVPLFTTEIEQVGLSIFWIPVAVGALVSAAALLWIFKKPWNLKKLIYGFLIVFVLGIGGGVLSFAKSRLTSVSFRLFTWISTWEMVRTSPILGNGVGSFKVVYPAFRRPQIIILEGKSNTETDHAEDEYIEVWQDEGMIGFGIFIWMVLTAIICGLKQLRWYSNIRAPDKGKKRKFLESEGDPRSYEVLGILGAYIGALIHWTVDVSIRFVSSGVFSGLLPGLLVAYARNHREPVRVEARLGYDRWIRLGLAGIWTAVFIFLKMELVPQTLIRGGNTTNGQIIFFAVLSGLALWILIEILDIGLTPKQKVALTDQYKAPSQKAFIVRFATVLVLAFFLTRSLRAFGNYFQADVHHNMAIFFSKQSVWRKSTQFEKQILKLPPDIRKKYVKTGGALEHYQQVIEKNPGFPMARYFTGNVYNDWGSQVMNRSFRERGENNMREAERLRKNAWDKWDLAEKAYDGTKGLAPNYVQTHFQVGLLNLKRAQAAFRWGEREKAKEYFGIALENFYLYRIIDPIFLPNYHRIAEILISDNRYQEAIDLYKEGLYYNSVVSKQIYAIGKPTESSDICLNLARVHYSWAIKKSKDPFNPPSPDIQESIKYFRKAIEFRPLNNVEAYKGLSQVLNQTGNKKEAEAVLRKAFEIAPNDEELKRIFRPNQK